MNPERQSILSQVHRVREGSDTHRHAPFARHMLRIPEGDFYALCKLFPALASHNPDERNAAWDSFERSAFAEKYRVGKIVRGVIRNGVISK